MRFGDRLTTPRGRTLTESAAGVLTFRRAGFVPGTRDQTENFHETLFDDLPLLFSSGSPGLSLPLKAFADSCEIDLENNTHTCQNLPAIRFIVGPGDKKVVIGINLDPAKTSFTEATFSVEYRKRAVGWTVNVGDSISNNGFAGDGANQSNDAEVQILDNTLSVYGSDHVPPEVRLLLKYAPLVEGKHASIVLTVKNQFLSFSHGGQKSELSSQYLYALEGQHDEEGPLNYDIYAAFNRTIASADRSGSGVSKIIVELK